MRHSKKPRPGRARGASADALFERALLGENAFDDGPSDQPRFDPRADRKTLQLCRQVQRALSLALAGECADELLRDVYVDSVRPMGGPGQLCVVVILPPHAGTTPAEVLARLEDHAAKLRAVVARQICRKRVPGLSFLVMPPAAPEPGQEGGGRGH